MAQSKRFYFWRGYYDALMRLPTDDQRGRFVMAMCAYAFDGEEPDFSDDDLLDFAWPLVADGTRESVRKGVEQSEYGQRGGRPQKHGADEKRVPKRVPKRQAKRVPESEEKRREGKGRELSHPTGERECASAAPDGAPRAIAGTVAGDGSIVTHDGMRLPPKPEGWD